LRSQLFASKLRRRSLTVVLVALLVAWIRLLRQVVPGAVVAVAVAALA
jgi:hypothetical protein